MSFTKSISAFAALAVFLVAGVASAQVAGSNGPVFVTTTPSSSGVTPGANGTIFGTINISGNGTYRVASIPITVTPSSGASAGALSNCQITNSSGQILNTAGNTVNSLGSGSNLFTFDTPLQVGSATTTLTVRCNVASTAISGSTYQFVAGAPVLAPGLGVSVIASPSVAAGATLAPIAILSLDASRSGQAVNVSSVPVMLTFNGAASSQFTNCSLRNINNLGVALNTGGNSVGAVSNGTATTITLDSPISVPAGGMTSLVLTCAISAVTPVGSTVAISVDPAMVRATNASNGTSLTPAAAIGATGSTLPVSGSVTIAGVGSGGSTPGVPNTGAGGEVALNIALLALSALVAAFGLRMLARRNS